MMRKIAGCLLIALYCTACSGPARHESDIQANTFTDLAGRKIRINRDVKRIILLRSKDIYELAALLGNDLPSRLIAWGPDLRTDDRHCYDQFIQRFPALKDIPETGSIYSDALSVEQLVALRPDLVIADKFILDRGYKYVEKLEAAGLPLVYLDGSSDPLTGSQKGIALLGQILNKPEKANAIAQFVDSQFNGILHRLKSSHPQPPTVYLEAGSAGPLEFAQTYGSSGSPAQYTSWGAVLHALGVRNIAEGIVSRQEKINPEYILKANPSIIVITGQDWTTPQGSMRLGFQVTAEDATRGLQAFATRTGWSGLAAIKNRRLYSVFHNTAIIICFAATQALAKDCYPDLFQDLDPDKNLRIFFDRFLPIPYSGTWMTGPL